MGKIINSTYVTLDGVFRNPQEWPDNGVPDPDFGRLQTELLSACDATLMGRDTYEAFAGVWQGHSGDPYTDRLNSMTKYVFSSTITEPDWANTTVLNGEVAENVRAIKAETSGDIVQYGFGPIAHTLLQHGLVDELRVWLHPLMLGTAEPGDLLFQPGKVSQFTLTDAIPLQSGIVVLSYALAES
jgi:dihydrofolate reductase